MIDLTALKEVMCKCQKIMVVLIRTASVQIVPVIPACVLQIILVAVNSGKKISRGV